MLAPGREDESKTERERERENVSMNKYYRIRDFINVKKGGSLAEAKKEVKFEEESCKLTRLLDVSSTFTA